MNYINQEALNDDDNDVQYIKSNTSNLSNELRSQIEQRRQRALKIKQEASTVRSAHPASSFSNKDNSNNMTNRALITDNEATNGLMSEPAVTLQGDGGIIGDKGSLGHASGDHEQTGQPGRH